jgi:uncharacterized protein
VNVDYPYRIDPRRRTALAEVEKHVRDLVEQLLFTAPGERVNRPTFGSGLRQLVFAPNSETLAAATQVAVQGALQEFLGERIVVESVTVETVDSSLIVSVAYVVRRTQDRVTAQFRRPA